LSLAAFGLLATPAGFVHFRKSRLGLAPFVGIIGLGIALVSTVWLGFTNSTPISFGGFQVDLFTLFFSGVLLMVAIFVTIASLQYMRSDPNQGPFFGLLLLSTLGMIVLAASMDLVLLYVGWELMSIPTYALTAFRKKDPASNEAAMKFFVLSALSSALIVYAISLVFGVTGSTGLTAIASSLSSAGPDIRPFGVLAIVLFIVGFGVKMAVVPFHMWIPDAFEGAPITIGAFLASGAKMAAFAAAFRLFIVGILAFHVDFYSTFAIVAVVTMTVGNVAALMQKSFTRLLAYSSIAQAGYILMALATPFTATNVPLGLAGGLFHVLNYAILKTGAFVAAAAVATKLSVTDIQSFNGLSRRMPQTSLSIAVIFLGLAGVPPLNGFFSKVILFTGSIYSPFSWGGYLALAALINSGFSMSYYGWVIKRMYFDEPSEQTRIEEPKVYMVVLWAATILIFAIGIYPDPWIRLAQNAAAALVSS